MNTDIVCIYVYFIHIYIRCMCDMYMLERDEHIQKQKNFSDPLTDPMDPAMLKLLCMYIIKIKKCIY